MIKTVDTKATPRVLPSPILIPPSNSQAMRIKQMYEKGTSDSWAVRHFVAPLKGVSALATAATETVIYPISGLYHAALEVIDLSPLSATGYIVMGVVNSARSFLQVIMIVATVAAGILAPDAMYGVLPVVETSEEKVVRLSQQKRQLETEVTSLERRLTTLEETLTSLEDGKTVASELTDALRQLQTKTVRGMDKKLKTLEPQIDGLIKSATATFDPTQSEPYLKLQKQFDEVSAKAQQFEQLSKQFEQKLALSDLAVEEQRAIVQQLTPQKEEAERKVQELGEQLERLQQQLQQEQQEQKRIVQQLTPQKEEAERKIQELGGQLDRLQQQFQQEHTRAVEKLTAEKLAAEQQSQQLGEELKTAQQQLQAQQEENQRLRQELSTRKEKAQAALQQLQDQLKKVKQEFESKEQEYRQKIATLTTEKEETVKKVPQLEERVRILEAKELELSEIEKLISLDDKVLTTLDPNQMKTDNAQKIARLVCNLSEFNVILKSAPQDLANVTIKRTAPRRLIQTMKVLYDKIDGLEKQKDAWQRIKGTSGKQRERAERIEQENEELKKRIAKLEEQLQTEPQEKNKTQSTLT